MSSPEYRNFAQHVGDGNAGRAWKRRIARIFDSTKPDPKSRVYVPISRSLTHAFLISIPLIDPNSAALIYGILNIGTFSARQADVLRLLDEPGEIEALTNHAQSYVLQQLRGLRII